MHGHPQVRASPIFPVADRLRALVADWAHVPGTEPPVGTDHGLREGRHTDPDGNLPGSAPR
ncbi:MAG: hypothetical protein ACJ71Y_16720 [Blastococcus sp.]